MGIIGWLMLRNIRSSVHHTFLQQINLKRYITMVQLVMPYSVLNSNGRPYHTLIISYKEDGKLKFASHTDNHKWKSLYNYIREGGKDPVRIYKM